MRHLLLALLFVSVVVAAPVPKETAAQKIARLFGEVVDAKKGYDFALDGDKLVVTMGANASETLAGKTPPRTERQVTGDFELRVTVTFAPPQKKFDDAGQKPFLFAGYGLWGTNGRVVIQGPYFGTLGHPSNDDGWGYGHFLGKWPTDGQKGSYSYGQNRAFVKYEPRHLQVRRVGEKMTFAESADGKEWETVWRCDCDLSETVRVGVVALNTSNVECSATFSDFIITPLKPAK